MSTAVFPVPLRTARNRRVEMLLAGLLAIAIALIFWSQQRYPALLRKMRQGTALQVGGPISFDALLRVKHSMPLPERAGRTAVNWLWTNRFGMYFALPFGAAVMTLFAQTGRPRRFESAAANVACGALMGMPAGVCTNCATPIGQSLIVSGASTRMTVAAMISSPMLNPVVATMSFLLFPPPLALLRLAVPLVLLMLLPLLVGERPVVRPGLQLAPTPEALGARLQAFALLFGGNLVRITLLTLPWMLLAAILGALAAETIPAYGTHLPVSAFGVLVVAVVGTLLPVPMAFDVGLAWVLYRAGVPSCYVAALLCTLGPVSVYSLSALGQQLGRAVPLRLAGVTALLGTAAGLLLLALPK